MSKQYPYIQSRKTIHNFKCEICKQKIRVGLQLEWRVDWFQGNCEFEEICNPCLQKREAEEEKRRQKYERRMTPIWEKERKKQEQRETNLIIMVAEMGLEVKQYANGQWSFSNVLDWWTTTGTAIARKSGNRYHLSFTRPDTIVEILKKEVFNS